jgi:DNA polymerase-3 subunit chi
VTRVDFYILDGANSGDGQRTACRIAEKAYKLGQKIFLHTTSAQSAAALDEYLWTFREGSFIPHALVGSEAAADSAVIIGQGQEPDPSHRDLLINLGDEVPLFFSRFERVAEIVAGDETTRGQARDRFRFYRDRGYPLNTHELGQANAK